MASLPTNSVNMVIKFCSSDPSSNPSSGDNSVNRTPPQGSVELFETGLLPGTVNLSASIGASIPSTDGLSKVFEEIRRDYDIQRFYGDQCDPHPYVYRGEGVDTILTANPDDFTRAPTPPSGDNISVERKSAADIPGPTSGPAPSLTPLAPSQSTAPIHSTALETIKEPLPPPPLTALFIPRGPALKNTPAQDSGLGLVVQNKENNTDKTGSVPGTVGSAIMLDKSSYAVYTKPSSKPGENSIAQSTCVDFSRCTIL